jgi:hypothetical protein
MLILPLFASYLQIVDSGDARDARDASGMSSTERFSNEYNNLYDKNGDIIESNGSDGVKYDIISALYLIMRGYNANYYYRWTVMDNVCIVLLYIVTFMISALAAYLSFSCTWKGLVDNIFVRLLFAFVAFLLGPFYLIWYILVNYLGNLC